MAYFRNHSTIHMPMHDPESDTLLVGFRPGTCLSSNITWPWRFSKPQPVRDSFRYSKRAQPDGRLIKNDSHRVPLPAGQGVAWVCWACCRAPDSRSQRHILPSSSHSAGAAVEPSAQRRAGKYAGISRRSASRDIVGRIFTLHEKTENRSSARLLGRNV